MRALLSVFDKAGLVDFARGLAALGFELVSTGGTARALAEAGLAVLPVEEVTGFPEMLDGRVKTLHPALHAGILARRDLPAHQEQLRAHGFAPIDLVAVNLYPFLDTIQQPKVSLEEALENIDVGGPTLLRAAAKNFPHVLVVCDPDDYEPLLGALRQGAVDPSTSSRPGESPAETGQALRRRLAAKAFQHIAFYDTLVAHYLRDPAALFPEELTLAYQRQAPLRYGENPHQQGALYREPLAGYSSLVLGHQALGQQPSLCNFNDLSAALETVREFLERPAVVVIKHATPSGFAFGSSIAQALEKAIHADATSAFGGVVGLNRPLDREAAQVIAAFKEEEASNIDAIVAPGAEEEAVRLLRRTRRRMILFTVPPLEPLPVGSINLKHLPGGLLLQEANLRPIDTSAWTVPTKATPTPGQWEQMQDVWLLLRHIRSNTILVWDGEERVTLGIGTGQVSRVGAARIALEQAGGRAWGALLASDGYFPFSDSVELAAQYGVGAIVQPGGSINDQASIEAADAAGIAMVLTGERAFWH